MPAVAVPEWIALVTGLLELAVEPACADEPERWWSKLPGDVDRAKQVCAQCRVVDACRAYGLAGERHGVWGGLTPADREALAVRLKARMDGPDE